MNKRLIASLLAVCVATGSGVQVPVQLLANTMDTHQSMSVAKERQILEETEVISSQFIAANQPQYQEEVVETDARITPFSLFNSPYIAAYDETFRVGSDRIVSITNNGGQYQQSALKYAIDEDVNTHWETGKPNSTTFKNEIIITLDQAEVIDRIVYKSRQGGKGFAKNFSLYASSTTQGDNFSKITTGEHAVKLYF